MQLGVWLRSPHCPALSPQGWGIWCLSHEDVLKPQLLKHKLNSSWFSSWQVRPLMYFLDCDPCFLFVFLLWPPLISSKGLKTLMAKNFPRRPFTSQYLWISTSVTSFFLWVLCGLSSADLLTHCILQPSVTLIISGSKNMKEEKALSSCTDWAILSLIWGVKKKTSSNHQSLPIHVSEQFERDRTPVMLVIPCSSAGETQLPAAEVLDMQAANKNDPALISYINFPKLYFL